jgi:hypothetical protein
MPRRPSLVKTSESPESVSPHPLQQRKRRSRNATAQADHSAKPLDLRSGLVSGARLLSRVNPRFAVAIVSCALFAVLLTRVQQDSRLALVTPTIPATPVTQSTEPAKQTSVAKQATAAAPSSAVAAARIIDAPAPINGSCREQAWPYVSGACLTNTDGPARTEATRSNDNPVASANSPATDIANHVVPAVLVDGDDAQAKMSPEDSLSVVIDRPRRARSHARRHYQAHAGRKRLRSEPQEMAFGSRSFEPLESSNAP